MFKPIFFEKNRVKRVYLGGKLFSDFFGDESEDGFYPEEWVASAVKAINKDSTDPKEGVSFAPEYNEYFDELLKKYPHELLGAGGKLRILVKFLDSAIRLPAQAHPDKAFSRKYFNSDYGKTECWLILATRPGAKIYFGFKDGVSREDFVSAIEKSEYDSSAMEALMKSFEPKEGEVYLVPAKTIHAIGYGCLILEIQEPTDFTIQPERFCGDYKLSDKEMYLSLTKEEAIECFDFNKTTYPLVTPRVISENRGVKLEQLIGKENTECFVINRITLEGAEYTLSPQCGFGVYMVVSGEGRIFAEGYNKQLKRGDYFFLPACADRKCKIFGNLSLVECY